jgi:acetylornithine deacetylase/succinyl-diaminopimelate desuccinylase-like protein
VRVRERLDELYAIGGGPGANRPHGSAAEDAAHELAAEWLEEAGLAVEVDAHGNLLGRTAVPDVWLGSHLDTVPRGGRFDGALGVVAAIEAVERVGRGAVVVFRGEEVGCIGSRALVAAGGPLPRAFLELHVEQGPVLADRGVALGVVTGIVGYARGELVVEGQAGHAGTTPMEGRSDALVAAIGFEPDYRVEPAHFAGAARQALADAIGAHGLPLVELPSGAGHDAGILASAGVDAAMLFVRSLNGGVSHSPDELSAEEDIALAVDVLADALRATTR